MLVLNGEKRLNETIICECDGRKKRMKSSWTGEKKVQ